MGYEEGGGRLKDSQSPWGGKAGLAAGQANRRRAYLSGVGESFWQAGPAGTRRAEGK